MSIGNSELFKSFARPILQNFYPNDGDDDDRPARQPGNMDAIIQCLINRAKLEVSLIRITNATADSFTMAIESRVTRTGPISSTISPVELDLTFDGSRFGRVKLPGVKTSLWGAKITIQDQTVKILDMEVFKAYIRSVSVNEETCCQLENGECTITAFGIVAHCNYCLDIPIRGMQGPKGTIKMLEREGQEITLTIKAHNPSPLEIDHGRARFELWNREGESMAELKGDWNVVRGDFDITLHGRLRNGVKPTTKVILAGCGVENERTWCNETIQYYDFVMDLEPEMIGLLERT